MIIFDEPKQTMSLHGGMLMYVGFPNLGEWQRYIIPDSPKGRLVRFLNDNGMDSDLTYAQDYFYEGQVLEVKEIYVGRSSSTVEFIDLPNLKFNTVHFEDITFKEEV